MKTSELLLSVTVVLSVLLAGSTVYGFGQGEYLPEIRPLGDEANQDLWCVAKTKNLVGKQLVEDGNAIVKHQSLPDWMKVTYDDLKAIKPIVRVVREGDMITMEFSPERVTVQLDNLDFITKAYCG